MTFAHLESGFSCYGDKNPNSKEYEKAGNAPSEGFQGLWPMDWPAVGGGGGMDKKFASDDMFEKMCAWHGAAHFLFAGEP